MSNTDAGSEFKKGLEIAAANQNDKMRFITELEHHERLKNEFDEQALSQLGCKNLQELRTLYATADAEEKRAITEFLTAVREEQVMLQGLRDAVARLNAPAARG